MTTRTAWTETRGRGVVQMRSAGACEISGLRAESVHHRKNRSQGGTWAPSNLLHINGTGTTGVHGWITEHPKQSRLLGWVVPSWADPADTPVYLIAQPWWRGWWRITDEGLYVYVDPEDAEAAGLPARPDLPDWAERSTT